MTNRKVEKAMLKVIQGLNETKQKMEQKQELKTWSNISVLITIRDGLISLSKDELSMIRKRLDIKGASHLKKGELVELLNTETPALFEKICKNLDMNRYKIIKEIIKNGGTIPAPKLEAYQFEYFRTSGFIFTGTHEGKKILVMPEEILKNPLIQVNDNEIYHEIFHTFLSKKIRYLLQIDNKFATVDEIEGAIEYIKSRRIIRNL